MLYLLEIGNATLLEAISVAIPESVGLLAFGVGLVVLAVLLRSILARSEKAKAEKETAEEV